MRFTLLVIPDLRIQATESLMAHLSERMVADGRIF